MICFKYKFVYFLLACLVFTSFSEDRIHIVKENDSLYKIAIKYGVTVNSIVTKNNIENPDKLSLGQEIVIPSESGKKEQNIINEEDRMTEKIDENTPGRKVHIVSQNETMMGIALEYGLSIEVLCDFNGISNPDRLSLGQKIIIPSKEEIKAKKTEPKKAEPEVIEEGVHIVKSGEVLSAIAEKYGVSSRAIQRANALTNPDRLKLGQKLRIPGKGEVGTYEAVYQPITLDSLGYDIFNTDALIDFTNKIRDMSSSKSKLRILFIGDSHIYADLLTCRFRELLQGQYGDGGRGLIIPTSSPKGVGQKNVNMYTSKGWKTITAFHPENGDYFGLSMKRRIAQERGAYFKLSAEKPSNYAEVWYWAHPKGQEFEVIIGSDKSIIDTYHETPEVKRFVYESDKPFDEMKIISLHTDEVSDITEHTVLEQETLEDIAKEYGTSVDEICELNDIKHDSVLETDSKIKIRCSREYLADREYIDAGVQLLGFVLENSDKGIVVDAAGLNGARVNVMLNNRIETIDQMIKWRNPDLVVLWFGTNEALFDDFNNEEFKTGLLNIRKSISANAPKANILIVSPPDFAVKKGWDWVTPKNLKNVNSVITEISKSYKVASWNLQDAMGGEKSVHKWSNMGLMKSDHVHMSKSGYMFTAEMLLNELPGVSIDSLRESGKE